MFPSRYDLAAHLSESIAKNSEGLSVPHHQALAYWQKARVYSSQRIQVYILMEGTDGTGMLNADAQNKLLGQRRLRWLAAWKEQQQDAANAAASF